MKNSCCAIVDNSSQFACLTRYFMQQRVQPDRVIFNALITACGQSGAVDRAFDVLAEMRAEPKPIDPDHVTVGALMRTCIQAGQV